MDNDEASLKQHPNAGSRFADSLFIGLSVVPAVLLFGGMPGAALLIFIPLLFTACLCGMWEQVGSGSANRSGASGEGLGGKTPAAGVSMREKL